MDKNQLERLTIIDSVANRMATDLIKQVGRKTTDIVNYDMENVTPTSNETPECNEQKTLIDQNTSLNMKAEQDDGRIIIKKTNSESSSQTQEIDEANWSVINQKQSTTAKTNGTNVLKTLEKKSSTKNIKTIQEKSLFLMIDHKLALRRRQIGLNVTNQQQQQHSNVPSKLHHQRSNETIGEVDVNNLDQSLSKNGQKPMDNDERVVSSIGQRPKPEAWGQATMQQFLVQVFMAFFITVVQVYTWLTLPFYFLIQTPWMKVAKSQRNRVKVWKPSSDLKNPTKKYTNEQFGPDGERMSPIYERNESIGKLIPIFQHETLADMINAAPKEYDADRPSLGYRRVIGEQDSLDEQGNVRRMDGRQLKRYELSDYTWLTIQKVDSITMNIAQGLMAKGVTHSDKVLIFSETRVEWMLCAQAIIRSGATIVTLFSNLGVDGVAHGIEETETQTLITSMEGLPILKKSMDKSKHCVKRIIYIDGFTSPDLTTMGFDESIEILSLSELEKIGLETIREKTQRPLYKPDLDHLIVLMYTSGTTGTPKAALMTHRQFKGSIEALFVIVKDAIHEAPLHTYISYLPMAHVLELTIEIFLFLGGVKIGYSSPFTLTDSAPGLAPGQKSDIKLLRPTAITAVPLVLDRILKEVNEKLRSRTPISQPIFKYLMNYKSRWTRAGYSCPIVRKLLCEKVNEQLGGNLQYMIVGGAPLSAITQSTIKSALDIILIQGYGATETTGASLCMDLMDLEYGRVGAPLNNVLFRLRDWPEGGYSVDDKPNKRGEILIGGNLIAQGYYKLPRQTEEAFFIDSNGIRWFRTGDIGELYPNGTIKIIDRCKDLIKLQNGEYISLGKVEAALKSCQLVDNVCVYGGTFSSDIVALISPNSKALNELTTKLDKQSLTLQQKCDDDEIEQCVYEEIVRSAKSAALGKKEIPLRIKLVPDEWSPDNGILTAALKLKRKAIETMYKKELYELYNEKKLKVIVSSTSQIPSSDHDHNNNNNNNNNNEKALNGHSVKRMP